MYRGIVFGSFAGYCLYVAAIQVGANDNNGVRVGADQSERWNLCWHCYVRA